MVQVLRQYGTGLCAYATGSGAAWYRFLSSNTVLILSNRAKMYCTVARRHLMKTLSSADPYILFIFNHETFVGSVYIKSEIKN
jgi:hypothetical protein